MKRNRSRLSLDDVERIWWLMLCSVEPVTHLVTVITQHVVR